MDQRYFQIAAVEFIREHGINELLFANNSFAVCTPYHIRCIDNLRHQPYVPYVPPEQETEEASEEADGSGDSSSQMDDKEKGAKKTPGKKSSAGKSSSDDTHGDT